MTAKQLHNFALFRLRESIYGTEDVRLHPHVLATYFQVPKDLILNLLDELQQKKLLEHTQEHYYKPL
nr:MAG TPA: ethanolamine utilization protein [Caudoviricetes sp.]